VVEGSSFADTLFGSNLGGDTLAGGAGSDLYMVYSSTTQILESPNDGGHDAAYIGVDNYQGASGIERIVALNSQVYSDHSLSNGPYIAGIDSGWHINGSVDAQTLIGSYGADILNGGGGADLLIGGAGDDVYMYAGNETIIENSSQGRDIVQTMANLILSNYLEVGIAANVAGDINITGNDLDNLLVGNGSANNLSSGAGSDTLVGLGGDDVYTGGTGGDTFVLNSQDSFMGEITDFHSGEDHLSLISTDPTITLSMAPSDGFTGIAGQLFIIDGSVQVDWNGDSMFDSVLLINEAPTLADFTIIDPNHISYF
jgi:Ca2+-binding RTX toxin-like protein